MPELFVVDERRNIPLSDISAPRCTTKLVGSKVLCPLANPSKTFWLSTVIVLHAITSVKHTIEYFGTICGILPVSID